MMAPKPQAKQPKKRRSSRISDQLKRLPRRDDTWQIDVRPVEATLSDKSIRRWVIAVVSEADAAVVAIARTDERPTVRSIHSVLVEAMLHPEDGLAYRPGQFQLRADRPLRGLGPLLRTVGVDVTVVDDLDLIDALFEQLNEDDGEGYARCLLDMPGVTPPMVRSLFQSAAVFCRRMPWKNATAPIQVEWPASTNGPWYAAITGARGTTRGLALSESLETVHLIDQGKLTDRKARAATAMAIVFGGKKAMIDSDLEVVEQYQLPLAGPRAYPLVFCQEPGPRMRPPLDWELRLLDGCLRAILKFLKTRTRGSAKPLEVEVTLPTGPPLPLILRWIRG
ncbi:MAG: hypothetical protein K2R98_17890 [Gemmataceae bacterium]|nr:hypothetical protein [Gemmataceae bacterium]